MFLPIDVVPGTNPPQFRWNQLVGGQVVHHEGTVSPTLEVALTRTLAILKQLLMDNAAQRGQIDELTRRLEHQDDGGVAQAQAAERRQVAPTPRRGRAG